MCTNIPEITLFKFRSGAELHDTTGMIIFLHILHAVAPATSSKYECAHVNNG